MSMGRNGKKVIAVLATAAVLIAGIAAGVKIAASLDLIGGSYNLKRTPLVENYEAEDGEQEELFQGIVVDEDGDPVEGVWVGVGIDGEKKPFVKMETDEEGQYSWKIEDEEQDYYLVFQKEDYITVVMEPDIDSAEPFNMQGRIMLLDEEEDKKAAYPVTIKGLAVQGEKLGKDQNMILEEDAWDAEYEQALPALEGAQVEIRKGINSREGEAELIVETGEDGIVSVDLEKGTYTAVISKDGFNPVAFLLYAKKKASEIRIPCVENSKGGWQIVLTWEGRDSLPLDLDSLVVSDGRLMNSLNRGEDENGRYLFDSYGKTGCEVIELPEKTLDYQYYVMDYSSIIKGGESGLKDSGAAVWVYQNGTLAAHFELPEDAKQPVWNPFAVKEGRLEAEQKEMAELDGPDGWNEDKVLARMNSKDLNAGVILSDGEWLYFANPYDGEKLYYIKKDGTGMTRLCDDRIAYSSNKVLDGDWIYYCSGAENGWGDKVWRIKTDGSGRELVKSLNKGQELELLGKADGKLFIWNRDKIGGELLYIDENGIENTLGSGLGKSICLVGSSLYYLNEAGYDGTAKGLHSRNLITGEDELVVPDVYWYQFAIKDGYIYYDEGVSMLRMQLGKEPEFIAASYEATIGTFLMYKDWIYYYDDGSVYRVNLDGTDNKAMEHAVGWYDIIDGELYTNRGKYDPIRISDLNGENKRILFDVLPYKQEEAAQAYYQYLCDNESNGNPEWPRYSQFAFLDINGDGLNELFYRQNEYGMNTDILYSFDGNMVMAEELAFGYKTGGTIIYDENDKTLAAMYRYGNMASPDEVTLYSTETLYPRVLDSGYRYSEGWENNAPEDEENAVKFDAILRDHWFGKNVINWVENTEENRNAYILSGQTTGYSGLMEPNQ